MFISKVYFDNVAASQGCGNLFCYGYSGSSIAERGEQGTPLGTKNLENFKHSRKFGTCFIQTKYTWIHSHWHLQLIQVVVLYLFVCLLIFVFTAFMSLFISLFFSMYFFPFLSSSSLRCQDRPEDFGIPVYVTVTWPTTLETVVKNEKRFKRRGRWLGGFLYPIYAYIYIHMNILYIYDMRTYI